MRTREVASLAEVEKAYREWIENDTPQRVLAERLEISQQALSKRFNQLKQRAYA